MFIVRLYERAVSTVQITVALILRKKEKKTENIYENSRISLY